jgi:signal transduction histidine kinase
MTVIESGEITLEPDEVNLGELVAQRLTLYHHLSDNKDISVDFKQRSLSTLRCDPDRITQVVDNFLSNAIKYSPFHSIVSVKLSESDGWHRFEVADNGCGISEENQEKLFNAYQRFSETTGGESSTGLGLVICKNFIEAHQGRIGYRDNEGGGSCFYFTLPSKTNHMSI